MGGVWIAPASHQASSGHLYRSCRSNQSLPDCLTALVVIRPTPVFCHCEFSQALTLPCFSSARSPCSGFLANSEPCTTASTLHSILGSLWTISEDNSPTWKIPLTFFLLQKSSTSSGIQLSLHFN